MRRNGVDSLMAVVTSSENATVLFTDVVGSTVMSAELGPIDADRMRQRHFALLRQAITATGGAEVKNLGDGLMVVFPSCSAAVDCAVRMQQAVELEDRTNRTQLGLRVGLSVGEATREADDYFGEPVVEAARLCGRAQGGQILCSAVVRVLAGRRSAATFASVGALDLKGLPEPLETLEVRWEPLATSSAVSIPLPPRLELQPTVGLIGRDAERDVLRAAYKRVTAGEGRQVVLICGEAGIGKTTLVAEIGRRAYDDGACVLLGRCDEELSVPFQPFVEAMSHLVRHAPDDLLRAHVQAHDVAALPLLPTLRERLGDLPEPPIPDEDGDRHKLFGAVRGLLASVAMVQPVVLVIDDLQWADKPSLQLLRHLVDAADQIPLLVLGTYRDLELSHGHALTDLLAAFRREPRVSRIELGGLEDTSVVALVEAAAGHHLDEAGVVLAHALYRETDGNPFFVGEVLRHLVETGAITQDPGGRWITGAGGRPFALPTSVREVVGARVARLGGTATSVLSVAAVIGQHFEVELLARATDISEDAVLDLLDRAAAAAIVQEAPGAPGWYRFSHAIIQHTLYLDLGPTRQARTHRRVAQALEALCAGDPGERVGQLAHHWTAATRAVDVEKAIAYSRKAAESALDAFAPEEAARYFGQAIELFAQMRDPDPTLELDLRIGLGRAQRRAGDTASRRTLLDAAHRAQELNDTERMVIATVENSRRFATWVGLLDHDKVALLEAALDALPPGDSRERALLLATLCSELAFGAPFDRRRDLADEAAAIARRVGDPEITVSVLTMCEASIRVPATLEDRVATTAEAMGIAEKLRSAALLNWAATVRSVTAAQAGDIEEYDRCMAVQAGLAEKITERSALWGLRARQACRAILAGDPAEVERLAGEALQIASDLGMPDALVLYSFPIRKARWLQGRLAELVPLMAQVVADNPGLPALESGLAMAYADTGQDEEARELLLSATAKRFAHLPQDSTWIIGMVQWAEVAIRLRSRDAGAILFDLLRPWHAQVSDNWTNTEGPVSCYLAGLAAVLGREEEAEGLFVEAAEMCTRMGAKFFGAQAQVEWGRMLSERQPERARGLLLSAQAVAAANGYAAVERRATEVLAALS